VDEARQRVAAQVAAALDEKDHAGFDRIAKKILTAFESSLETS
jgi:hypothetical protein